MHIDRLTVRNFKRFTEQSFDFNSHFTLLVGDNGAGKTSVLDALAVAMGIWHKAAPGSGWRNILEEEIRLLPVPSGDRNLFVPQLPTEVTAEGTIGGESNLSWTRMIKKGGVRTTNAGARQAEQEIQRLVEASSTGAILFPVLAYYGAGRAWLPTNKRPLLKPSSRKSARMDAYFNCLDTRIRDADLNEWFLYETAASGDGGKARPGFRAVKQAILECIPEADDIRFDSDRKEIVLCIAGAEQPFYNLSAGQRMMLALVADIAIKAITLNSYLLSPTLPSEIVLRTTQGIVLIDELDVHLHPRWQRRVATDLKRTFPRIQFICTSHSPQVMGEVSREEVRLLAPEGLQRPSVAFGADSNWLLDHVMKGASSETREVRLRQEAIENAIARGDLEEARIELDALRELIDGDTGELARLESSLSSLELLARDAESQGGEQ